MLHLYNLKRANQIFIFILALTWIGSVLSIEIALFSDKRSITDFHLPLLIFLATSFVSILAVLRNTNQTLEQKNQEITIAKQKFAETARDLESLLESMDALILVIDQEEKIKRTNSALENIVGKSKEQLFGQPLGTILADLNPKPVQSHSNYTVSNFPLIKALHGANPEPEIVKLGCLDQENFFLLSANPVVNKTNGEIVGAISLFRDITEIRMLDKLKDEFIGTVSHELKTPLAVIKGFAQLQKLYVERRKKILDEMEELPYRIQEFFDPVVDESTIDKTLAEINVMAEMIDQMVHITRIDSGRLHLNMVYINLLPLIQDIITGLDLSIASNRIELITDGATYYPAYIDPSSFRQVLHNLISNAIKYSPPESPITVHLTNVDGKIEIAVQDRGIGISLSEQLAIFSKFYRTQNAVKVDAEGLGLGLYITARLVELQGGTIDVYSELNQGSTFQLCFPAAQMEDVTSYRLSV